MPPATDTRRPPGPRGLPLLGNGLEQARRPLEFFTENARTYGDVVYWELINEPIYQLNHPDTIESVLVTHNERFIKGHVFQEYLRPILGRGLLNSEGERWRAQRHRMQPLFHPDQIAAYATIMVDATERRLDRWSNGARIDINEEMMGITLEIVARALLGVDIRREIDMIGDHVAVILGYVDSLSRQLMPPWAPTPSRRRFERSLEALEAIVYRIIDERKRDASGTDVVSRLIAGDEETSMDDRQLRDEVMTFFLAGHETTALALTYTWYLLATHPDVEARLRTELESVVGDEPLTQEITRDLPYADQVITESLRLYPPVATVLREPVEDVRIDGYRIPAGATIWLPQWVVHRDPRWYPDPLAFNPDRWSTAFKADLPHGAYFPFAAGPRRCIGDRFARLEALLVLATILQRYHLELRPETIFEIDPAITSRLANPIEMTVHRYDGGSGVDAATGS